MCFPLANHNTEPLQDVDKHMPPDIAIAPRHIGESAEMRHGRLPSNSSAEGQDISWRLALAGREKIFRTALYASYRA